ncbi:MAG: 2-oxoacid:acceptor oxidoreductase family protein [bacterium]
MADRVCNVRIAGLGGMGILKSSQLLASVLFQSGYDVKKAEVHGMSQRGGSVASDIRFGKEVLSPMIPNGEADYLLVLAEDELVLYPDALRPGGILIGPSIFAKTPLPNKKSLNVAMLGALSHYLDIPIEIWTANIRAGFPEKLQAVNFEAFNTGRNAVK